jgi:hypothetical protein
MTKICSNVTDVSCEVRTECYGYVSPPLSWFIKILRPIGPTGLAVGLLNNMIQ